jgi:DegV family protein with EDD domain
MTVAIVTDSAAALPEDLAIRCGVTVVPMWLTIGGQSELEGKRPLAELLEHPDVLTAAPAPGEYEAAVKEVLRTADAAVVLTLAEAMSASNEAARVGTASFDDNVAVVDTGSAAGGQALVVLAAAAAAAEPGATLASVVQRATWVAGRVRLVATLPSLDHLVRGGRVPGIAGWAGKRLGIHPLFEFRGGAVRRMRPALSSDAAADRIVAQVQKDEPSGGRLHVAALHALALSSATDLLGRLTASVSPAESFVGEFGPVMVVHTGPGLSGLAWWWDDPADSDRSRPVTP